MPLSRDKKTWAAYCDACLVGSFVYAFDNERTARYAAVAKLHGIGWTHEVPRAIPPASPVAASPPTRGRADVLAPGAASSEDAAGADAEREGGAEPGATAGGAQA